MHENTSPLAKYGLNWTKKLVPCVEIANGREIYMQPVEEQNETIGTALTAADRCDVCGAQAYIKVSLATGELLFCAHHGNANKEKLEPLAKGWQDETDKLLAK